MRPRHLAALALLLTSIPSAASAQEGPDQNSAREPARAPALQGRPFTPAGELILDADTGRPAVGALPVAFVRSPDASGPGGRGRYLVAVNSGYGIQLDAESRPAQSLAVIDLNAPRAPEVVQNVYFPSPQSAQVGVAFSPVRGHDGAWPLYVSGGFENKVWIFRFAPDKERPISPGSPDGGPEGGRPARSISVTGFATKASSPRYHSDVEPVYPLGLALSGDGDTLFVANHLADNLGIVRGLRGARTPVRLDLRSHDRELVYPYGVVALADPERKPTTKVYVSCWGTDTIAVVDPQNPDLTIRRIAVLRHPTAMLLNPAGTLLYVVNSNADAVSVIDTASDQVVETIEVGLAPGDRVGSSPEGLALTDDGSTLYVANSHSQAVAVVALSDRSHGLFPEVPLPEVPSDEDKDEDEEERSRVVGFIPTGLYPSAVAVVGNRLLIGNGKGTGFETSSLDVNETGMASNAPNERFPARPGNLVGQYVVSLVSGNVSWLDEPDAQTLSRYTQQAMRSNGLIGPPRSRLFEKASPIRHVIYVIKENRSYDQVFGDLPAAGNGESADGEASLAIFGAGAAARRPGGPAQNITPNHRALALRFGLFDRFFVNSEASPDGHNWTTAAFSSDFVDKSFRWSYSGRGGSYDFEGFNRLPDLRPREGVEPVLPTPVTAHDVVEHMKRYVPYLQGGRDVAEPESLYLWDAAARAGLTYRNYGEFVGTVSRADVEAFNANAAKPYPDLSPNEATLATKRTLEGRHSPAFRNYDLETPDAMTVESYVAARSDGVDPVISSDHENPRFRGHSRLSAWLEEFRGYVRARQTGAGEELPNLSIVRLPNNHTAGLWPGMPTPQFMVAENDYALGVLVEAVSKSPYWRDTAVFVVEDDAQNGPDHVDAHRSPALVISAYNRPGELVHEFHNTVSLIRTLELLLGIEPMNVLDAAAVPIDIFRDEPDLTPYEAILPEVALDNLMNPEPRDAQAAYWAERTLEQNLEHADMADPEVLNRILWFSVRGPHSPMPAIARLPAFDAMRFGIASEADEDEEDDVVGRLRMLLASRGRFHPLRQP